MSSPHSNLFSFRSLVFCAKMVFENFSSSPWRPFKVLSSVEKWVASFLNLSTLNSWETGTSWFDSVCASAILRLMSPSNCLRKKNYDSKKLNFTFALSWKVCDETHFRYFRVLSCENRTCLAEKTWDQNFSQKLTCLTNEAKLLCLKYFGRILSENSVTFFTIKAFPSLFQHAISL